MKKELQITVNGDEYNLFVDVRRTLLEVIREDIGLTGAKNGCGAGECGACTVLLAGEPVNSCLVLAHEADGGEVITIEGLAQGGVLHPVQQAFVQQGAIQCGFCTPGWSWRPRPSSIASPIRRERTSFTDSKATSAGALVT